MTCSAIIHKILSFAFQATILLICIPPLLAWSVSEMLFVEFWRQCGPARRNPNRARSSGIMFRIRTANRRRLSIPSAQVDNALVSQSTANVSLRKSRGFFDLPYEIREQIWLDVLCPVGGVQVTNHPRVRKVTWTPREVEEGQISTKYGISNILKLNRDFYREGIALLYAHNSFAFSSANVLTTFSRTILPQRLALIKHLTLKVHYRTVIYALSRYSATFMEDDWQAACVSLQNFTGLKTLRISIIIESYVSRSTRWDKFGESEWPQKILGPLEPLNPSDSFIVDYTWPESDCSEWPKGKFKMVHQPGYT